MNGDSESKMNRKEVGESLGKQSCENSVAEEQIDKADIDQAKEYVLALSCVRCCLEMYHVCL